jgi:hypothetical protein
MAAGVRCFERRSADGGCCGRARRGIASSTWGACGWCRWHLGALRSLTSSAEQKVQSPRGEGASPDARLQGGTEAHLTRRGGSAKHRGAQATRPPATAHIDAPARSAGQRHRHRHAASSTSAAKSTSVKAGLGLSVGVSAGVSLLLTASLLGRLQVEPCWYDPLESRKRHLTITAAPRRGDSAS